jgi:hypothetical protein
MEPISTAAIDALITECATGERRGRGRVRAQLLRALAADGHGIRAQAILCDRLVSERRREMRQAAEAQQAGTESTREQLGYLPKDKTEQGQEHGTDCEQTSSQSTRKHADTESA